MRISQQLDYAVRGLVALATLPEGDYARAADVAASLGIPQRFFEQQIGALAKAGIVACRRGRVGGCRLARSADRVTLADVAEALEGDVLDVPRVSGSAASEAWADVAASLRETLASRTLAELAQRQRELDAVPSGMYYI